jgi:hypothetical protein
MIVTVCKDRGGWQVVEPVAALLQEMGYQVVRVADGLSEKIYAGAKVKYQTFATTQQFFKYFQRKKWIDVLITSMCPRNALGWRLVPFAKATGTPVVAIHDRWDTALWQHFGPIEYHPDFICVNDDLDKQLVLSAWPDFNADQVWVTGYPSLDRYRKFDVEKISHKTRKKLALKDNDPLVVFAGQRDTADVLLETVKAMNQIMQPVNFVAREHPSMRSDAPEEIPKWLASLATFNSGQLIDSSAVKNTDHILAAADVVLTMTSTALLDAAVMRKQTIALLYHDRGMADYLTRVDNQISEHPLISLGCVAKAGNAQELMILLSDSYNNRLGLFDSQVKNLVVDGNNAARVVENLLREILLIQ